MYLQKIYYLNGVKYDNLSQEDKSIIDRACEKLREEDLETTFEHFENSVINLITTNPQFTFIIQSEFPQDLTGKLVWAYTRSRFGE